MSNHLLTPYVSSYAFLNMFFNWSTMKQLQVSPFLHPYFISLITFSSEKVIPQIEFSNSWTIFCILSLAFLSLRIFCCNHSTCWCFSISVVGVADRRSSSSYSVSGVLKSSMSDSESQHSDHSTSKLESEAQSSNEVILKSLSQSDRPPVASES